MEISNIYDVIISGSLDYNLSNISHSIKKKMFSFFEKKGYVHFFISGIHIIYKVKRKKKEFTLSDLGRFGSSGDFSDYKINS